MTGVEGAATSHTPQAGRGCGGTPHRFARAYQHIIAGGTLRAHLLRASAHTRTRTALMRAHTRVALRGCICRKSLSHSRTLALAALALCLARQRREITASWR